MILEKIEERINQKVQELYFEVTYNPGIVEELDTFKASHDKLPIACYGETPEQAIQSARDEAHALFLNNMELMDQIQI